MTQPSGAVVDAPAPTTRGPAAAAALAARIQIPRRLPVRYDGQPMRHLSNSSYTRFLLCPEDWRRHYLKGERTPPTGAMFLGARVDDAVSGFYARQLEHGEILDLDQVRDLYRDRWHQQLADEHAKRGVRWEARPQRGRRVRARPGRARASRSLSSCRASVARSPCSASSSSRSPRSSGPCSATWTSRSCATATSTPSRWPRSSTTRSRAARSRRPRPTSTRRPACTSPGAGSKASPRGRSGSRRSPSPAAGASTMSSTLITTTRTLGQQRATLARIAQAASQIHALYERYGPDEPWGFADPTGWKCGPRYCSAWHACPGGAGL